MLAIAGRVSVLSDQACVDGASRRRDDGWVCHRTSPALAGSGKPVGVARTQLVRDAPLERVEVGAVYCVAVADRFQNVSGPAPAQMVT